MYVFNILFARFDPSTIITLLWDNFPWSFFFYTSAENGRVVRSGIRRRQRRVWR